MNKNIKIFNLDNFEVTKYYPYSSRVSFPIFQTKSVFSNTNETEEDKFLFGFWKDIETYLRTTHKIDASNKVVVKLKPKSSNIFWEELSEVYIGCYDSQVTIGLSVWQDNKYTHNNNKDL